MPFSQLLQLLFDLFVELPDALVPAEAEQVHLCQVGLLQLTQLLLVPPPHLMHLHILHQLLQRPRLPLVPLRLHVLPPSLALLLLLNRLLTR